MIRSYNINLFLDEFNNKRHRLYSVEYKIHKSFDMTKQIYFRSVTIEKETDIAMAACDFSSTQFRNLNVPYRFKKEE